MKSITVMVTVPECDAPLAVYGYFTPAAHRYPLACPAEYELRSVKLEGCELLALLDEHVAQRIMEAGIEVIQQENLYEQDQAYYR